MKFQRNDPALADLPPPVSLTPDQLEAVATETGAALGGGLSMALNPWIYGGIRLPALAATAMVIAE